MYTKDQINNIKTPQELAMLKVEIAVEIYKLYEELVEVKRIRREKFVFILAEVKNYNKALAEWKKTDAGFKEEVNELQIKGLSALTSSIQARLDVMKQEKWNNY